MFKYTPPWQVLCNSMEHEPKKQSEPSSDDLQDALPIAHEDDLVLIPSDQSTTQAPLSDQEGSLYTAPMESTPRKWVMQPMSPKLEMTDLRALLTPGAEQTSMGSSDKETLRKKESSYESITVVRTQPTVTVTSKVGDSPQNVLVQARQVAVSDESSCSEDWHPSSPSSPSSSGSNSGFYSFVDRSLSPEAEKTEAWMSSPERVTKLAVLKEENGYKLRAYMEKRKPEKLFEEASDDSCYKVEDIEKTEQQEEEQIKERLEIIRSQAPKINPVFKEQWHALESLDLNYSSQRLLEGLSLSYSPVRTEVQQTRAEPGTIDTEKISFSAARQQFLKMEQSKRNPFLQSPQQLPQSPKHQEQPSQPEVIVTSKKVNEDDFLEERQSRSQSPRSDPVEGKVSTRKIVTVSITEARETKQQSSVFDDLDSGLADLSLDPGGEYPSDGTASNETLGRETGSQPLSASKAETPIEREIRILQEREESLRQERGIRRSGVKEMVEIKTKPLLSQTSPALTPVKAKEKNRVSFLIQREIERDSKREEDLQHQGKVPCLYDRGTTQELEERKRIFELQEDQIPVMPTKRSFTGNLLDSKQLRTGAEEIRKTPEPMLSPERTSSPETDVLSPCCPHRHPDETALRISSPEYFLQSPFSQKRNQSAVEVLPHSIPATKVLIKDDVRKTDSQRKAYSYSTSLVAHTRSASARSRSSSIDALSPSSDTPAASPSLEPAFPGEPTPQWRGHYEQFNLRPRKVPTPDAIRREIELELKREEEHRKLQEARGLSISLDGGLDNLDQLASSADTTHPAPLTSAEEDRTSVVQDLKGEVMGQEKSITTTLTEEQITKNGTKPFFFLSMDTVDSKKTALPSPTLTPGKTRMKAFASALPSLSPSPHVATRLPSVSMMTAQPWSSPRQDSPGLPRALPLAQQSPRAEVGQKGLTETLLEDFEERKIKLKLEETSYAGIQPTDDVNNEVLEATRVTRHKNQRALLWEAGRYANENGN